MKFNRILLLILVISLVTPNIALARQEFVEDNGVIAELRKYEDFGIHSYSLMPSVPDCSDTFDQELYYAGIATGIDPAFLKVVLREESRGNPDVLDNQNTNGTTDIGIMQINSSGLGHGGVGLEELKESDKQALRTNYYLNIWASTQVIKTKYADMDHYVGTKIAGHTMGDDAFAIFWSYNSRNASGYDYAERANGFYVDATKLSLISKRTTYNSILPVLNASGNSVAADKVIINPEKMRFEEFASAVEGISEGRITVDKSNVSDSIKNMYYMQGAKDESTGTGLQLEQRPADIVINYQLYRFVKSIVTFINFIIQILTYIALIVLMLLWASYIIARAGVPYLGDILYNFTNGNVDVNDEGSLGEMIKLSLIVIVIIATVLTGVLPSIIETAFMWIVNTIGGALI